MYKTIFYFNPLTEDGVLSLFNVSRDTSGYYICTSTNMIRSAKCNLTLSVMPCECFEQSFYFTELFTAATEISLLGLILVMLTSCLPPIIYNLFAATMNIGATAGIIGGCVAGVAVLVLTIYCCCKDKRQPEEFAME